MADSYLEFSEMLTDLSTEEAKWLKHQLEVVHVIDGKEYPEDDLPDSGDAGEATWIGCRAYRDMEDFDEDYGEVGFEYELKDDDEDGKHYFSSLKFRRIAIGERKAPRVNDLRQTVITRRKPCVRKESVPFLLPT